MLPLVCSLARGDGSNTCHIGERKLGDGREEKVGRHGKSGAPRAERALGQGALEMMSFGSAKSCGSK